MRKIYTTLLVSAMFFSFHSASAQSEYIAEVEETVAIYPNPVKSFATISFTYQSIDRISIMNIVGREIKSITPETGKQEVKVSLVDLQPGVYFLAAYYQGNTLITKKFLKED
ncbi:MAG: T9SS type A sorting domain-containing protein [Chitinophagales bacterium]|jgi:hypothetical protein|nr:T9SS type A sorting domain-containing protein [Bacteroidota bacterium]MBK7567671.1 T9SS type A sorting domain-containing protein [Bacteroidota bacterium]MBP8915437.1 T9SS type A sorting domain-containing protein [Chitinophagales bacterium]MBP9220219.1 T9SS type A sorting domain-containing protein [Chitinophagales bacterium]MBP9796428.1 T9SS type A sorting domain-containing protein [Chitinophagales bacterium]